METELTRKYFFLTKESRQESYISDPVFIFNDPEYLLLEPGKIVSCYLRNNQTGRIAGFCHFQCENHTAWSPLHAPFASIYLSEDISFQLIGKFVSAITRNLGDMGIENITLGHYPDFYTVTAPDKLIAALLFEGFQIKKTDINHHLRVTESPFDSTVRDMQKRRINKCERMGFRFQNHPKNDIELIYDRIREFRMQKNIPVRISVERLKTLFERFPERYFLFSVKDSDRIIAATIMVSVNASVVYNFLPASDEKYSTSSPMVYLIKNIYDFARKSNFRYVDLGISSIMNQPQSGLITFKENLGGIPGIKFFLEKSLVSSMS